MHSVIVVAVSPCNCFESLIVCTVFVEPRTNKRRFGRNILTKTEEDEPPQLSRCPSPVDEMGSPEPSSVASVQSASISKGHIPTSADPPALIMSQPLLSCTYSQDENANNHASISLDTAASSDEAGSKKSLLSDQPIVYNSSDKETTKHQNSENVSDKTVQICDISDGILQCNVKRSDATSTAEGPRVELSLHGANRRVSQEDTLDSIVSSESHMCLGHGGHDREGLFDQFRSMTVLVDCDSSYGSAYGRVGALTSDSDTLSSSPDRVGVLSIDSDGNSGSPAHQGNRILNLDTVGSGDSDVKALPIISSCSSVTQLNCVGSD